MGRKASLHCNRNSLLCLVKEPKTVFIYGKEKKWFEEADKGSLMLEHDSNDAVKLIALTVHYIMKRAKILVNRCQTKHEISSRSPTRMADRFHPL